MNSFRINVSENKLLKPIFSIPGEQKDELTADH
jgi:hypothetical protein